jgi:hypothetical protein
MNIIRGAVGVLVLFLFSLNSLDARTETLIPEGQSEITFAFDRDESGVPPHMKFFEGKSITVWALKKCAKKETKDLVLKQGNTMAEYSQYIEDLRQDIPGLDKRDKHAIVMYLMGLRFQINPVHPDEVYPVLVGAANEVILDLNPLSLDSIEAGEDQVIVNEVENIKVGIKAQTRLTLNFRFNPDSKELFVSEANGIIKVKLKIFGGIESHQTLENLHGVSSHMGRRFVNKKQTDVLNDSNHGPASTPISANY